MKKVTRYSIAFCHTADLHTQYGTWGDCYDHKATVRHLITSKYGGWGDKIIGQQGDDAFETPDGWLVVEPVEFIHLNWFDRITKPEMVKKADANYDVRITPMTTQGSIFRVIDSFKNS